MYIGEYSCKIDSVNRLIIPSKISFQSEKTGFVLTYIDEDTLVVCNQNGWTPESPLRNSIYPESKKSMLLKYVLSNSYLIKIDKQRRIVLPACIFSKLSFKDECLVIGMGAYFKIVNKLKYEREKAQVESEYLEFLQSNIGEDFKKTL